VWNFFWLVIWKIIPAKVPKLSFVSAASSCKESISRVKLGKVDVPSSVSILASLLEVDSKVRIVLQRLNLLGRHR